MKVFSYINILLLTISHSAAPCAELVAKRNRGLRIETNSAFYIVGITENDWKPFQGYMISVCARERNRGDTLKWFYFDVRNLNGDILFSTTTQSNADSGYKRSVSFGVHINELENVTVTAGYQGRRGSAKGQVDIDTYEFEIKRIIAEAKPINTPDERPVTNLSCEELQEVIQNDADK